MKSKNSMPVSGGNFAGASIHVGDNHEMFFYFEEEVDRLPKGEKS